MNKELTIIDEREILGKEFKMYGTFEEPLFLAKDVAEWIEHTNVSKMVASVDEEEKETHRISTLTNSYSAIFLTEDGLYEVLMQSRKPIAKDFKKQVKVVVKELRKTGRYDFIEQQIQAIEDETEKNLKLTIYNLEKIVKMNPTDVTTGMMLNNKQNELAIYLQGKEIQKMKTAIDNMVTIGDRQSFVNEINAVARATGKLHKDIYSETYRLLKSSYGIDLNARVRNERQRLQDERLKQGKKLYAPKTLESKVNALVIADEESLWNELGKCLFDVKNKLLRNKKIK